MEFVYSINNQDFGTLDDKLTEIESDYEEGEITHIYKAVKVPYRHSDFISGSDVTEKITDSAYDSADEFSENYCTEIEKHKKELEEVILKYLNENITQPDFYQVKDIEKLEIGKINE